MDQNNKLWWLKMQPCLSRHKIARMWNSHLIKVILGSKLKSMDKLTCIQPIQMISWSLKTLEGYKIQVKLLLCAKKINRQMRMKGICQMISHLRPKSLRIWTLSCKQIFKLCLQVFQTWITLKWPVWNLVSKNSSSNFFYQSSWRILFCSKISFLNSKF